MKKQAITIKQAIEIMGDLVQVVLNKIDVEAL